MAVNGEILLSEDFGGEWPNTPLPVWRRLANAAQQYPNKLALACLHQPANLYGVESLSHTPHASDQADHLQWTFAQLDSNAERLAAGLLSLGLTSGSSIVSILKNGIEFPMAFWAAHKMACPFVPLNPRNLANGKETQHMLSTVDAKAVFVNDLDLAVAFDSLYDAKDRQVLKIMVGQVGESTRDGWITVADLLEVGDKAKSDQHGTVTATLAQEPPSDDKNWVTVLFTSGTTSLPKGCPHTNRSLNAFMKNLSIGGASPQDIFCSVLPNNHAMGYFFTLHFLCNGGAVVYPSPSYEPAAMAQALTTHKCTHTGLVPTALHSFVDYTEPQELQFPHVRDLCLAGTAITPKFMRQVINVLGTQGVSTGFGMTEGSPVWAAPTSDPEKLIRGDDVVSGQAVPGVRIRICAQDSKKPLPRGQPGEIHESGPGVILGYIGTDVGKENFYVEGGRTWFKTGDRGVMYADGRISIVGRYKDMIIRGGENIAPAAIEAVLNEFPGIEAQVVGTPDDVAGEVPVALVRNFPAGHDPAGQLLDAVRKSMGMLHIPDEVILLEALGLEDYPRTASGKIQKGALRTLVAAHRRARNPIPDGINGHNGDVHSNGNGEAILSTKSTESIEETVLYIWWKATGIEPAKLDKQSPTFNFADSITIMRVRNMYRKEFGVTLSVKEMSDHADLESQILALQRKTSLPKRDSVIEFSTVSQGPSLEDIQIAIGPDNDATVFKQTASAALANQGFDFDSDAQHVIRTNDFIDVLERENMIETWNFGIAVIAEGSSVQELKDALIATLTNNPIWTSFYVHGEDKSPFYITMKPQKKLYDQILHDSGSISTVAELVQTSVDYPHSEHSRFPGPLYHALLYNIEENQSAGFVFYVHHIVHDASSMRLMLEDLNRALLHPAQPLRPHVPYELWSDMYHSLRSSPRASLEVDWHVKRLANIHKHRKALYPPEHAPRQAITTSPDGLDFGFEAPSLLNLKRRHSHITASVVLKAAMALVNITRTKHTHALFMNFEASRSTFPFWPDTLRHVSGANGSTIADLDASDVAGPTMSSITNIIPVDRPETAIDFLNRLQTEQSELTKRSQAPLRRIISRLNDLHPGENAGEMIAEINRAQVLTWVPAFLGDYEKIRVESLAIRAAVGIVFVAGLGGPQATTYMIGMRWDVANYSAEETTKFVQDTGKAVLWLLEEENWNAPVSKFLDGFEELELAIQ